MTVGVSWARARAGVIVVCSIGIVAFWAGPAAAGLPDGRGYELVSPTQKNGGDVMAIYYRARSAIDGSAAAFSSLSGSGDAVGTGVATDYLSQRTAAPGTQGWATHAITPPQPAMSYLVVIGGLETTYEGDYSPDLSKGVVRAWSPLTDAPNVANVANLYLRDDLRAPGAGSYQLVSDCPLCVTPFPATLLLRQPPLFVAASSDFGHILFDSSLRLATGAGGSLNAYEWDHGTVRLAAILPNGQPAASSTVGGWGNPSIPSYLGERAISTDGRRIIFTAPPDASNSNLYMRVDATQTVQLNASERTVPTPAQAALFEDASNDGTRVFFLTAQALTDDAPLDSDSKLYMYDATQPTGHHLTYVSHAPGEASNNVQGVIGASPDGHTVYFIDGTQIVPGEPATSRAIFAWHDGTISYVSDIGPNTDLRVLQRETDADKISRIATNGDLLFTVHLPVGPTGYDQGACGGVDRPCGELYLYRLATHAVSCVSCNPSGAPATTEATDVVISGRGGSQAIVHEPRAISDDGTKVFFTTAEALVPEDVNNTSDAYEYDATAGQVHLISSGTDPSPSYSMDMTPDGRDLFFVTRERLVGWDVDTNYDLYDARVGGGFPDPPAPAPACTGTACQGAASVVPARLSWSSGFISGVGNKQGRLRSRVVRARACRRGRVRRLVHGRVRCVLAPRHKSHAKRASGSHAVSVRRRG